MARACLRTALSAEAPRQQHEGGAPGHAQCNHPVEAGHHACSAVGTVVGGRLLQRGDAIDAHAEGTPCGAAAQPRPPAWRPVSASMREALPVRQERLSMTAALKSFTKRPQMAQGGVPLIHHPNLLLKHMHCFDPFLLTVYLQSHMPLPGFDCHRRASFLARDTNPCGLMWSCHASRNTVYGKTLRVRRDNLSAAL